MHLPIYLDNNATTPVDPRVLEAMLPYLTTHFGNAGSKTHSFGWQAQEAADTARRQVAEQIGARPADIVFTSGATEADNLAILGAAAARGERGGHIITGLAEHKAVLDPIAHLEKQGFTATRLKPDATGRVSADQVTEALRDDTFLVSLMAANNEVGTLNPTAEIGAVTRERGILFHTDAAQAVAKVVVDVEASRIDLLSLSAHKIYGPKGVGALYVRQRNPRARIAPISFGGGQENGLRPGTLSVPLMVALGEACRVFGEDPQGEMARLGALAERLAGGLEDIGGVIRNGHPGARLPGTVHVSIERIEAEALLLSLPDVAISSGAACTSATPEPSHVLRAMGMPPHLAFSSFRFAIGRFNREDEIEFVVDRVRRTVEKLRG